MISVRFVPLLALLYLYSGACAQVVIESFDGEMDVSGATGSFASGPIDDPWQFSQESGFIRFEPRNGGAPNFNGSIVFRNDSGVSFDNISAIELTALTFETPPPDARVWLYLITENYEAQIGWGFNASDFVSETPLSVRFDFADGDISGALAGKTVAFVSLDTYLTGDPSPFRMEFHNLSGFAAVPEPSCWAGAAGCAAALATIFTRQRRRRGSAEGRPSIRPAQTSQRDTLER